MESLEVSAAATGSMKEELMKSPLSGALETVMSLSRHWLFRTRDVVALKM